METDSLSEIRQEVFRLFQIISKKGVTSDPNAKGSEDADWKAITGYTQDDWNKRKALEAPREKWRNYQASLQALASYKLRGEYRNHGGIGVRTEEH